MLSQKGRIYRAAPGLLLILLGAQQLLDIFADQIHLNIDQIARLALAQSGYLQSMGNNRHAEGALVTMVDRQADAINGN